MATQNLELFYKPTCPYCHKVMSFMEQNNIELPMHDIVVDDAARERLIEVGGKRQVPCLFIDGKAITTSPRSSMFLVQTMIQTTALQQLLALLAAPAPSKLIVERPL